MRLFAATLGTETNTFSPLPTGMATFKERLLVAAAQHFYAGFAPLAEKVLYVDAPGSASSDITRSTYQKIQRPLWPFDQAPS